MSNLNSPHLTALAPADGAVDFAAIEREAHRMRAEAMRQGALAFTGWLRLRLHPRQGAKTPAGA